VQIIWQKQPEKRSEIESRANRDKAIDSTPAKAAAENGLASCEHRREMGKCRGGEDARG
jgi:hypothetical protein